LRQGEGGEEWKGREGRRWRKELSPRKKF